MRHNTSLICRNLLEKKIKDVPATTFCKVSRERTHSERVKKSEPEKAAIGDWPVTLFD